MLEAARWAPSCYNEQPWAFAYTVSEADRAMFASALYEQNQVWAAKAPLLMYLVVSDRFKMNGKENTFAQLDAGAAWISLAFEARKLGIYTHGMAGYYPDKAAKILGVNTQTHTVALAIAAGHIGDKDSLPEALAKIEYPNERKRLSEMTWPIPR